MIKKTSLYSVPLSLVLAATALCGAASAADGWHPQRVDWFVAQETSPYTNTETCQIHWQYDDSFDLSYGVRKGQAYFLIDFMEGSSEIKELAPLQEGTNYQAWVIGYDGSENAVLATAASATNVILPLASELAASNSLKNVKNIYFENSGFFLNFPIENARENFSSFQECVASLGQSPQLDNSFEMSQEANTNASVTPAQQVAQKVIQNAAPAREKTITRVMPISNNPELVQRAYGSYDNSSIEIAPEFMSDSSVSTEPQTVRLTPPSNAQVSGDSVWVNPEFANSDAPVNAEAEEITLTPPAAPPRIELVPPPQNTIAPEYIEPVQPQQVADESSAVQQVPIAATTEAMPTLAQQMEASELKPPMSGRTAKQNDNILQEARPILREENPALKRAGISAAALENYKKNQSDRPIIENLMKKLSLLEVEKEQLRKKLLTVKDDGLLSEIVACEPTAVQNSSSVDDDLVSQFETTIERMREENAALQEQLSQSSSADAASPELELELAALKEQVNKLKDRNSELLEEVSTLKKPVVTEPTSPEKKQMDGETPTSETPSQDNSDTQTEQGLAPDSASESTADDTDTQDVHDVQYYEEMLHMDGDQPAQPLPEETVPNNLDSESVNESSPSGIQDLTAEPENEPSIQEPSTIENPDNSPQTESPPSPQPDSVQ